MTLLLPSPIAPITSAERAERLSDAGSAWSTRIEADSKNAQLTFRVRGSGEGSVATRITAGKHEFHVDEPFALAGDDVAASPVEIALGALISCQVVAPVERVASNVVGETPFTPSPTSMIATRAA